MYFLLSTGIGFKTHSLRELEQTALAAGFDGLELMMPPRNLPPDQTTRDTAYETVSTLRTIHAPTDIYDAPRFASALHDAVAVAQQTGVPLVNIHPASFAQGGRTNIEQAISLLKETERQLGLIIAYEVLVDPLGLAEDRHAHFVQQQAYTFLEDYLADVAEFDLAATLDTAHLGTWHVEPHEYILKFGRHLKHVHISDYSAKQEREHLQLGEGDLDLGRFLQELQQFAPDISVAVELHPPATREAVEQAIRQSMEYIKRFVVIRNP